MRGSKIIFLVLVAVIVDIDNILCHPNPSPAGTKRTVRPISATARPAFILTGPFDTGANSMKEQIKRNSLQASPTLHLAHVFPWSSIEACVIQYWNNNQFTKLDQFVKEIFTVDNSAQAPTKWTRLNGRLTPESTSFITHKKYLRRMPASPSLRLGNTATMFDQNTHMKNVAKTALKNRDSTTLLTYLQSAPANLRYGEGAANIRVNDRLDPMGHPRPNRGAYEVLSAKEGRLLIWYNDCGSSQKAHYGSDGNYLLIPSSSSRHGEIRQPL